ncbi:MAG: hypothetical protein AAFY41_02770 [Bacteroidota bacterium]
MGNIMSEMPQRSNFHMTEPQNEQGLWCFWITVACESTLDYVRSLDCIIAPPHYRELPGVSDQRRTKLAINPCYDYAEAWLWVHDELCVETRAIELDNTLEKAIEELVLTKY